MKTPREILLKRHQAAAPKLDAVRRQVMQTVFHREARRAAVPEFTVAGTATLPVPFWRELFFSLRWHLAGMSAAWLVVAFLSLNAGHSPGPAAPVSARKIPSAQIIMASLRENRRQLLELMQPAEARGEQPQKSILPRPRSQRPCEILTA